MDQQFPCSTAFSDRPDVRERLAEMFEQAPGVMALLTEPQHRVVLANEAFLALVGDREVVGRNVAEVLPAGVAAEAINWLNEAYRSGKPLRQPEVRFALPSTDGAAPQERVVDLIFQPITGADRQVTGVFVQGSDVTNRVSAERRLQGSFSIKTVGIIYWNADFRLADVNDAFLKMTGFTREEALGRTWQELTPEEFWPASERAVEQVNTVGEAVPYEKQLLPKGRKPLVGSLRTAPGDRRGNCRVRTRRDGTPGGGRETKRPRATAPADRRLRY